MEIRYLSAIRDGIIKVGVLPTLFDSSNTPGKVNTIAVAYGAYTSHSIRGTHKQFDVRRSVKQQESCVNSDIWSF